MSNAALTQLPSALQEAIARIPNLQILNAGWEGGEALVNVAGRLWRVALGNAGGMGIVIPELPLAVLEFSGRRGLRWSFANVSPLFSDLIEARPAEGGEKVCGLDALVAHGVLRDTGHEWTIAHGEAAYRVHLWSLCATDANSRYAVPHYLFEQRELWGPGRLAQLTKAGNSRPETDIYEVPAGAEPFPPHEESPYVSSRYAMAQFQRIRYVVFARSVAHLYYGLAGGKTCLAVPPSDVLLGHDYHASLAVFFERPYRPIRPLSIGHNLGYQGIDAFYCPNSPAADVDCREATNWLRLKQAYADLMGLSRQQVEDYFLAWPSADFIGTPNWLQAILRQNFHRTGLATTTVSPGYAAEQERDRKAILQLAGKAGLEESTYAPDACGKRLAAYFDDQTAQDDLFVPNHSLDDLRRCKVVGVLNGMLPERKHLVLSGALARILQELDLTPREQEQLGALTDFIRAGQYRSPASGDRAAQEAFRARFDRAAAALQLFKQKARSRLFSQFAQFFGTADPAQLASRPLLFAWGRLVSQKAFHILDEAVRQRRAADAAPGAPTRFADALIIVLGTAPSGDKEALEVERRLQQLHDDERQRVPSGQRPHPGFVFVNRFDAAFRDMCLAAADAALLTSLYEPCGLTDIEAYWFGTPCVVHAVGGLTKGVADFEMYTQIKEHYPPDQPVAEAYHFYDNTDPAGEAAKFAAACERLLGWDEGQRKERQLKALTLLEFSYEIPANRYTDLIQFVWLSQVWRGLKDSADALPGDIVDRAVAFIRSENNGFCAGTGSGCCGSLAELYARTFAPLRPARGDAAPGLGVSELEKDLEWDRTLYNRLR